MHIEEARKIIAVMMVSYPNFKPIDTELMATTWADMLAEYTYEQVSVALKCYIATDTSGFAPSVGKLIQKANLLVGNVELNEIEAWTLVSKALRNGYYGAEEEFAKLPPTVQRAVGSPSQLRMWATTDEKSVESVISSNFMRTYKAEVKRAEEYARLPEDVRVLIQNMSPMNGIEKKGD